MSAFKLSSTPPTPPTLAAVVERARAAWLRTADVVSILADHAPAGAVPLSTAPPASPSPGSLYIFDRRAVKHFRRDGHAWRTKGDGRTVRETHERLKAGARHVLACYYARSAGSDGLQRRCYWLLDNDAGLVLVHYLAVAPRPSAVLGAPIMHHIVRSASAPAPVGAASTALPPPPGPAVVRAIGLPHGVTHQPGPNGVTVTTGSTGAARRRAPAARLLPLSGSGGGGSGGSGGRPTPAAATPSVPSPFASADFPPFELAPARPPGAVRALALARAATLPAQWRAAGCVPSRTLGPLHAAPSWDGATVSTGETLDAASAAAVAKAEAVAAATAAARTPLPPPPPPGLRLSPASALALEALLTRFTRRASVGDDLPCVGVKRKGSPVCA